MEENSQNKDAYSYSTLERSLKERGAKPKLIKQLINSLKQVEEQEGEDSEAYQKFANLLKNRPEDNAVIMLELAEYISELESDE